MYLFQQIKNAAKGVSFKNSAEAQQWYREQAALVSRVNRKKVMNTADPFKTFQTLASPSIGKMYMFFYDAKHKDTLPFFDQFPLIFLVEMYDDGFLGLNLHYLPPFSRAQLMNALYEIANNQKYDKSMKLMISYRILKASATQFAGFENCIKRYLFGHVRSSFHYVNPIDWDKALMLPLQKWHINPNKKYTGRPPY